MKVAYLDCISGISGDMMLGALIDAGADIDYLRSQLDTLGLEGMVLEAVPTTRRGFRAIGVEISHPPQHAHRHLSDIVKILEGSRLTVDEKRTALEVFNNLAKAEAKVHGSTIEKVHFHEVGAIDSIADIVGVSIAVNQLGIRRFVSSPVPTGTGQIKIAHGLVSVPAPATAELLVGCEIAESDMAAELTTPTGAAFIKTFVDSFGPIPSMKVQSIGIGCGSKDFQEQANIFRVVIGDDGQPFDSNRTSDEIVELESNVDDVTGEQIGHCVELLMESGALDVFLTSIQMKKNRPGTKISVLCKHEDEEAFCNLLFKETKTLGIRKSTKKRTTLSRSIVTVETAFGKIAGMASFDGERFSPEFESCKLVAQKHGVSLVEVMELAVSAFAQQRKKN